MVFLDSSLREFSNDVSFAEFWPFFHVLLIDLAELQKFKVVDCNLKIQFRKQQAAKVRLNTGNGQLLRRGFQQYAYVWYFLKQF